MVVGFCHLRNLCFLQDGDSLVHWTHSFLYFHNSARNAFLQDGIFHKKVPKILAYPRIDTAQKSCYTGFVGPRTPTPTNNRKFFQKSP